MTGVAEQPSPAWEGLVAELSDFTADALSDTEVDGDYGHKDLRDVIHGFIRLHPWEAELVDSPLLQRLRYIHQTALSYQLYQAAHHTRLDHSIGAAKLVSDVADHLRDPEKALFPDSAETELRLAALLHDVGHCLFSHLTEGIIERQFAGTFRAIRDERPELESRDVGEILSHAIMATEPVRSFLEGLQAAYELDIDIDRLAGYCIGQPSHPSPEYYRANVITGPLDVDKLDYLCRDRYFTGIRSDIDVPHIVRAMTVVENNGSRYIVASLPAVSAVEQLHWARAQLYPAVYFHQKVRGLECLINGVFEAIREEPDALPEGMRFESVSDYFRASEYRFLALEDHPSQAGGLVSRLSSRRLLKRALVVSKGTVNEVGEYQELVNLGDKKDTGRWARLDDLRDAILDELPDGTDRDRHCLWVDVPPKLGVTKDIQNCEVLMPNGDLVRLTDGFPIEKWLSAYGENKWESRVFYLPDRDTRTQVSHAAGSVLKDRWGIGLNRAAYELAKVQAPS